MAIQGNGTQIYVNGSGNMVVQTGGTDRLSYNYTQGTLSDTNHVTALMNGGFGQDVVAGANNYLDPITLSSYTGTFTFTGNRFYCPRTGAYRMTASALCRTNWHHWAAKNDGQMNTGAHNTISGTGGYTSLGWSWICYANAGDHLEFRGNQNSGKTWGGGWTVYTIEYIG